MGLYNVTVGGTLRQ